MNQFHFSKKIGLLLMLILYFLSTNLFATYIDTKKYEYKAGEKIYIQVVGLSSHKKYWLGVYKKSSGNNWKNVVSWPIKKIKNGFLEVEKINSSGDYEARLFYKDTYDMVDLVEFNVINDDEDTSSDCGTQWYKASLTNYISYPNKNSEECKKYNGCTWAGQFYGLDEKKSKKWVKQNNIVSVHMKDWDWLGLHKVRIRKGKKEIMATVYDACNDDDCDGCCTRNLGNNNFLIDMEKYTKKRFGSGSGTVEFQICD